mmetsp:Transcript_29571/g.78237  ORF Transcript_29571/g.78237 Transcript_29571/m.78237 type:complete len:221 (+) Transcript_29571:448-1110(+)
MNKVKGKVYPPFGKKHGGHQSSRSCLKAAWVKLGPQTASSAARPPKARKHSATKARTKEYRRLGALPGSCASEPKVARNSCKGSLANRPKPRPCTFTCIEPKLSEKNSHVHLRTAGQSFTAPRTTRGLNGDKWSFLKVRTSILVASTSTRVSQPAPSKEIERSPGRQPKVSCKYRVIRPRRKKTKTAMVTPELQTDAILPGTFPIVPGNTQRQPTSNTNR